MTTYRLVDHGYPFKKIMCGRVWVGRVCAHAEGGYLGIIGKDSVRAATERGAFEEIAARAMGYSSAGVLKARNARVRGAKRMLDRVADAALNQYYSTGNIEHLGKMLEHPAGAVPLMRAFTRQLKSGRRLKR